MLGAAFGGDAGSAFSAAAVYGAIGGGIGAGISVAVGAALYPFDKSQDVYLAGRRSPSKTATVAIVPVFTNARRAVLASLRF